MNQPPLMSFVKEKSYDAAIILGIHSRHGTARGVIAHTMNGITETEINGEMIGEVQMLAAYCGHFSIPVVLVSGDKAAVEEAKGCLEGVSTVVTKEGLAITGARCFHPDHVCREIQDKTEEAMENLKSDGPAPLYRFKTPLAVKMHFASFVCAPRATDYAAFIPTVNKIDEKTVEFECENIIEYFKMLTVIGMVAGPIYSRILN